MDLKNLHLDGVRKTAGVSAEEIVNKLTELSVPFEVHLNHAPREKGITRRGVADYSDIRISVDYETQMRGHDPQKVLNIKRELGSPFGTHGDQSIFQATYNITQPRKFIDQFNALVNLQDGKYIQETVVTFIPIPRL